MRFFRWLIHLFVRDQHALPASRSQCASPTDDEGWTRCEGLSDPDCRGGCCLLHCRKLCGERCKPNVRDVQLEECSSVSGINRCQAVEDPRCKGGNCTMHCSNYCGGTCLRQEPRSVP